MTASGVGLLVFLATLAAEPMAQTPPPSGMLEGAVWTVLELAGTPVPPQQNARAAHLVFGADGRLSGSDGCNRLAGPYTVEDNRLTFGQIAGTMMACPGTDEIAGRFRGVLKGTSRWRIAGERLELYGATGKPLAVFERRVTPPPVASTSTLQGTTWQLVRFQGGDDRTLTPDDRSKFTIAFAADGLLSARLDCNRGRGTWTESPPAKLELGPLAVTRAKCPEGSLHDQMVTQWTSVRSFVIKNGHLFLSLMADGGTYEFEPQVLAKP